MESLAGSRTSLYIILKSLFSFIYLINPYVDNLTKCQDFRRQDTFFVVVLMEVIV